MRLRLCFAVLCLFALVGCESGAGIPPSSAVTPGQATSTTGSSDNRAFYMKEVVASKEGFQTFTVYFTLSDSAGALTRADGTVKMEISTHEQGSLSVLMSKSADVKKADFKMTEVGEGSLAHQELVYSFGSMTYAKDFDHIPTVPLGDVRLNFTSSDGNEMVGQTTLDFDTP